MPTSPSIQDIDTNFQVNRGVIGPDGLLWVDAKTLTLEGIGWPDESQPYSRFPDRSESALREEMWNLSRFSAGMMVRFISDAASLAVRWSVLKPVLAMAHMPAASVSGVDLYIRDPQNGRIRWAGAARPETTTQNYAMLLENQTRQMREYFLYLPLYNGVTKLELGTNPQATIAPASPRHEKPLCFYGASILQGACASRPGMSLTAQLGRQLERAVWNFGFSGNSHAEPEVAQLLAELDPALYIIGPAPSLKEEFALSRLENFFEILRQAHPQTPVVFVSNAVYQDAWTSPLRFEATHKANQAMQVVFNKLQQQHAALHFIEGTAMLGDDGEAAVDGTHPTDVGFLRMSDALAPQLQAVLVKAMS
jgi:hypothetical protein